MEKIKSFGGNIILAMMVINLAVYLAGWWISFDPFWISANTVDHRIAILVSEGIIFLPAYSYAIDQYFKHEEK